MARGKSNGTKKIHLVNWDVVCSPKNYGGTGIRDMVRMNLALGSKIMWSIVSGEKGWWKEILRKKYMKGVRKRCVDGYPLTGKGSPIWNLSEKATHIIKNHLHWSPSNSKQFRIWQDILASVSSVNHLVEFSNLKKWLDNINIFTLYDLSSWKNNGILGGWKALDVHEHLMLDFNALYSIIQGYAHVHSQLLDRIGWVKSWVYTIK